MILGQYGGIGFVVDAARYSAVENDINDTCKTSKFGQNGPILGPIVCEEKISSYFFGSHCKTRSEVQ